ncbi:hypothetical protein KY285_005156 [Solanum tuberosum]|nr:hypothetical protein KY284_005385 [Solanum tuberosum]KAH0752008.1 hypothetical protein KY285_005156 [Solanum tuberosum]
MGVREGSYNMASHNKISHMLFIKVPTAITLSLVSGCHSLQIVYLLLFGEGVSSPPPLTPYPDVKDGYFGELKKKFYWDVSISESEVKRHWLRKVAIKYKNFISKIKGEGIRPGFVPEHVWERWMQLWRSNKSIKKSNKFKESSWRP